MAYHEGKFNPRVGVGFALLVLPHTRYTPDALARALKEGNIPRPPNGFYCTARLDTGTTQTMIAPQVVEKLELTSGGDQRSFVGSAGPHTAYPYQIDLLLPFDDELRFFSGVEVLGNPYEFGNFEVLLGLDILCQGEFTMRSDGTFTWTIA